MKYRLLVKFGKRWIIGLNIYECMQEAIERRTQLLSMSKKHQIKIVDEFGATI